MKIAVIGGGAAGLFFAANFRARNAEVIVCEKSRFILEKLKLTGGGRCNLTNAESDIAALLAAYPRGGKSLRNIFRNFPPSETIKWFESRGLKTKVEDEKRVFPASDSSADVASLLEKCALDNGAKILRNFEVESVRISESGAAVLESPSGIKETADFAVFARGGKWGEKLQKSLEALGVKFTRQIPSLFGFKSGVSREFGLEGVSVKNAKLSCAKFGLASSGGFLFTHEGISGPCVLKMSSLGAENFFDCGYSAEFTLNLAENPEELSAFIKNAKLSSAKKRLKNFWFNQIPQKLWIAVLASAGIDPDSLWADFSNDAKKRLVLSAQNFKINCNGKSVNAAEFVCCGGVDLSQVDLKTMRCKTRPEFFFAGECLNIDAFTGGFNLQAAWSTSFAAAKALEKIAEENL
ncbi:MAG: aminoacetone oxidase family FAD-binding enzyme [Opitutales bacterium]|nr:aminoacetone oxidase family FAD-binding enzyme [Opitutales bacterium]